MSKSLIFKITLAGDGAVGKTSLRNRFMGRGFNTSHLMTIGADFSAKEIEIEHEGETYEVVFQIWDMAGQKRFQDVRSRFYLGSNAAICVFDITRPDSFVNINCWIEEVWKNNGQQQPYIPILLLANKSDKRDKNSVPIKDVKRYVEALSKKTQALGYNVNFLETSALTGQNVNEAFIDIGKTLITLLNKRE